ncbi:MAG: site-specific integrase [Patescibacteria group bacterium]|nr:site-specific integrase [Patescibacteria group bacterium]
MIDTADELIRVYKASPEGRRPNRHRERAFRRFLERFPRCRLSEVEHPSFRRRLYDWRDTFAERPGEAKNMILYINVVFNWAVDRGLIRDNPAAHMKLLRAPSKSRADIVWRPEEIRQLLTVAPPWVSDVVRLMLWTGMRVGDALAITANNFDHGWLVYRPSKTSRSSGVTVYLPYYTLDPLLRHVSRLLYPSWSVGSPILRNKRGEPYAYSSFYRDYCVAMAKAGLADRDLHLHDLRGTLVTWLLEAECTDAEVASISGHAISRGTIRHYAARSKKFALGAYEKLSAYVEENGLDRILGGAHEKAAHKADA